MAKRWYGFPPAGSSMAMGKPWKTLLPVATCKNQLHVVGFRCHVITPSMVANLRYPVDNPMIHLRKLSYFTHLKSSAIKGDDSPQSNHDEPGFGRTGFGRDDSFTQIYHILSIDSPLLTIINHRFTIVSP